MPTFVVPCTTGHLPAFSSVFASMFSSDCVPVFFERLLEAAGMRLPGLGERLEPVGDLVEAFPAGNARHARIHVGVFVGLAGDRGLEVVAGQTDRLAGRRVVHFLEIFEMTVRVPGLALGSRAEHGGDNVEALDVGLLGEIKIAAARLALAGERFLQILLGLGSLERRHVPSPAWSEKPVTRGCARRSRESNSGRRAVKSSASARCSCTCAKSASCADANAGRCRGCCRRNAASGSNSCRAEASAFTIASRRRGSWSRFWPRAAGCGPIGTGRDEHRAEATSRARVCERHCCDKLAIYWKGSRCEFRSLSPNRPFTRRCASTGPTRSFRR